MLKLMRVLMLILCLGMMGCASKLMQPVDPATIRETLAPDEAGIVFFRSTSFGGAIQAPVAEAAEDGKLSFVAVISAGKKYLHKTTPGKHFYLVGGESAEFLEAEMDGGKVYYAYISPRMGWAKARFVFIPVTNVEDAGFRKDLAWCDWVQNTPDGQAWFMDNQASIQSKYVDSRNKHLSAEAKDKKLILPSYGSPTLIK